MDATVLLSFGAVTGAVIVVLVLGWKGYKLVFSDQENDRN
ncbi:hypothetical protein MNBD_NITROSPINAE01-612 [hydrothermal vent metagenome]|uniref:Uncharacterized protein n=1 Tax=hydrothermal vent metagenome TaxID=652676 RepID=A0A3B1CPB7_9ZZZZ